MEIFLRDFSYESRISPLITNMILRHTWLVLTVLVAPLSSSPHCPHCCDYGVTCREYPDYPFLPAPPGKTPPCAKHGATYCEKVDRYPANLIRYLVDHWGYDFNTLLTDETRDVYRPRILAPYGPSPGYHYGPPQHVSPPFTFYPQPHFAGNTINFTHGGGYPDRRYPLGHTQPFLNEEDPGYIYSALLQPQVTHYNPADWWKRYTRSPETRSKKKVKKRQADLNGGDIQLCPITSDFVIPKAAVNNKGNWMYIVNLDQDAAGQNQNKYMQLVRSETCITNICNGICSLPNGYTSRCEQQYVQKRLVALEGGGNQLYTDLFWFPHSCVCKISPINSG